MKAISNGTALAIWVNATFNKYGLNESDGILLARYCPLDYCNQVKKLLTLTEILMLSVPIIMLVFCVVDVKLTI